MLPHGHAVLRLVKAIGLELLTHRHPVLDLVGAIGLKLLALRYGGLSPLVIPLHLLALRRARLAQLAIHTQLVALRHSGLCLLTAGTHLLPFSSPRLTLLAVHAHLLALRHTGGSLHALRTSLRTFSAHLHALGTLGLLDGEPLLALHPGSRNSLLPLHARSGKTAAALNGLRTWASTTATPLHLGRAIAAAAAISVRTCSCRGCDRQRGDAGCEKDPGHEIVSFRTTKRLVRYTVPTVKRMEPAF